MFTVALPHLILMIGVYCMYVELTLARTHVSYYYDLLSGSSEALPHQI